MDLTVSHDLDSSTADGSLTSSRDGTVLRLTLDRASHRNSLSHSMIETFVAALSDAATDDSQLALSTKFVPLLYSLLEQSGTSPIGKYCGSL